MGTILTLPGVAFDSEVGPRLAAECRDVTGSSVSKRLYSFVALSGCRSRFMIDVTKQFNHYNAGCGAAMASV